MDGNRHFIFSHECGSSFAVDANLFCEKNNDRMNSGGFRCPNCNQPFDFNICNTIGKFFGYYKTLSTLLSPLGLSIEESPACKRETWELTASLKSHKVAST